MADQDLNLIFTEAEWNKVSSKMGVDESLDVDDDIGDNYGTPGFGDELDSEVNLDEYISFDE